MIWSSPVAALPHTGLFPKNGQNRRFQSDKTAEISTVGEENGHLCLCSFFITHEMQCRSGNSNTLWCTVLMEKKNNKLQDFVHHCNELYDFSIINLLSKLWSPRKKYCMYSIMRYLDNCLWLPSHFTKFQFVIMATIN